MKFLSGIWLLLILSVLGCQPDQDIPVPESLSHQHNEALSPIRKYLFTGHIRGFNSRYLYDQRMNQLDLSQYDEIFLLGDLAEATTESYATLESLNARFNFASDHVHWSPGNHDYGHPERIPEFTRKPFYYTFHREGITFLMLDSQIEDCQMQGDQLNMIRNVCDSLSTTTTLFVLTHKLIWLYTHPDLHAQGWQVPNGGVCNTSSWCTFPNNFMDDVFPILDTVAQKGVKVYCIAGDIGFNYKGFEYTNPNGIEFLATGLGSASQRDMILEFSYQIHNHRLSFAFVNLNDKLKSQQENP